MKNNSRNLVAHITRREALYGLGTSIGSLAFSSLLHGNENPTLGIHHPVRAKRCIFTNKHRSAVVQKCMKPLNGTQPCPIGASRG